jgi:signal transduction histidine kinase/AmiR/NasT family two-component response regulator
MSHQQNRRVLVVDDQASIQEDFKKILGKKDGDSSGLQDARSAFFGETESLDDGIEFDLVTASQGQEGVELLRQAVEREENFAMAFVDVRMPPGIDGLQTIKGLWEIDPDLQVVICTAYSDYSFDEIIGELGHSDRLLILKKPFDPVEVRQLASALTEKWNILQRERLQMQELREANVRAESANRAKSEFLANMSHEIRTPMNALMGYVDLLCDPQVEEGDRAQYGRTIRKSGEHLLQILNDILDVSSIEASRLVVNAADFSPFEVAFEVASLMRSEASERDLEISVEVPRPIPEVIESDLVRVRQILLNLVGNAIKFTRAGSVKIVLRLDGNSDSDHRYLCFDVIDTGIGIPPEKLERIFEPFGQADSSLTREFGGTGLGLTIAKRLALLLGGDIEAKSEVGKGSTFTLSLYGGELSRALLREYTPAECRLDQVTEEPPVPVDREDLTVEGRVLVVEDVKFNQLLIGALLRKAGAEVSLAADGKEGYDAALVAERDGEPFDLVLMDMQMPVMDGYEASQRLRGAGFSRPIVALTAHAMKGDREKCLEAGCTEYATKPIDKAQLLLTCRRLIALERTEAALPSEETSEVSSED